jgi:hypothetical protein
MNAVNEPTNRANQTLAFRRTSSGTGSHIDISAQLLSE